jgi:hypothetical protein
MFRVRLVILVLVLVLLPLLAGGAQSADTSSCPNVPGWTNLGRPSVESDAGPSGTHVVGESSYAFVIAAGWEAPDEVYVGARNSLQRSRNCGSTWEVTWRTPFLADGSRMLYSVRSLSVLPKGRIYMAGDVDQPILISDDHGYTVKEGGRTGRIELIAGNPATPDLVYGISQTVGGNFPDRSVRRSSDAGQSWRTVSPQVRPSSLFVHPRDATTVFLLRAGDVLKSTDYGESFSLIGTLLPYLGIADGPVYRFGTWHSTVSWDASRVWIFSATGEFLQADGNLTTWLRLPDPPFGPSVLSISASRHNSGVLFVLTDGGELWIYREPMSGADAARP